MKIQERITLLAAFIAVTGLGPMFAEAGYVGSTEPITLSIYWDTGNAMMTDGINDLPVLNEIKRITGVSLDFVRGDKQKLKVLAAGGDLPDIVELRESPDLAATLIGSKAVVPMDDLLKKHGANLQKAIPVALKWSRDVVGKGKTYFIPVAVSSPDTKNPSPNGFVNFFTRWDIYKSIGAPPIKGEDEYLAVLKKMVDAQPKTKTGQKVYGLSAWSDWGLWPYTISYPFSYGYVNQSSFGSVNKANGAIENNFIDPNGVFWNSLKFFNKAYRLGIFDVEGLTQKYAQYEAKIKSGAVLASAANWLQPEIEQTNETAINVVLPGAFPVIASVYQSAAPTGYMSTNARGISAKCKYPERAMQLLNWFATPEGARILMSGVKGFDWDVIEGKPQLIGKAFEAVKNSDPKYLQSRGIGALSQLFEMAVTSSDEYPVNLANSIDFKISAASVASKGFAQYYGKDLSFAGQVYDKWVKEGKAKTFVTNPLGSDIMAPTSDVTTQTLNKADQYVGANLGKIILAPDSAAFEAAKKKMIQDVLAMGAEKAYAEVQANLKTATALAKTFQ